MSTNPYAPLVNPPKELTDRIDAGELSLEDVVKRTRELTRGLIDAVELTSKSHIFGRHVRSDDIHIRTLIDETILKQPLAYNPNGLIGCHVVEHGATGLLEIAILAHEDDLAQHVMTHGAVMDCQHIPGLLCQTLKDGSLETVKALLDWYQREAGWDYPHSIQHEINTQGEGNGGAAELFKWAIKSSDIESILLKVDFLLGQGFAPFKSSEGKDLLASVACDALKHYFDEQTDQAADVLIGLLQRGFGRFSGDDIRGILKHERKDDGEYIAFSSRNVIRNNDILTMLKARKKLVKEQVLRLEQEWHKDANIKALYDQHADTSSLMQPEDVQVKDMLEWYGFNSLKMGFKTHIWRGHEAKLFELYDQLPAHVQESMWQQEKRPEPPPTLTHGAIITAHREAAAKPLSSWASKVSETAEQHAERG